MRVLNQTGLAAMTSGLLAVLIRGLAALGSAMRQYFSAAPGEEPPADYPSDTRRANPWERDSGPLGL